MIRATAVLLLAAGGLLFAALWLVDRLDPQTLATAFSEARDRTVELAEQAPGRRAGAGAEAKPSERDDAESGEVAGKRRPARKTPPSLAARRDHASASVQSGALVAPQASAPRPGAHSEAKPSEALRSESRPAPTTPPSPAAKRDPAAAPARAKAPVAPQAPGPRPGARSEATPNEVEELDAALVRRMIALYQRTVEPR